MVSCGPVLQGRGPLWLACLSAVGVDHHPAVREAQTDGLATFACFRAVPNLSAHGDRIPQRSDYGNLPWLPERIRAYTCAVSIMLSVQVNLVPLRFCAGAQLTTIAIGSRVSIFSPSESGTTEIPSFCLRLKSLAAERVGLAMERGSSVTCVSPLA